MNTYNNGRIIPPELFSEKSITLFQSKVLESKTRFWNKTPCQEWQGAKQEYGYGQLGRKIRSDHYRFYAHRFSYMIFVGEINDGLFVLHRCDNPVCVNPLHLFLGTDLDNSNDKLSKERQAKGEKQGCSKLTEKIVKEIRELRASSGIPYYEIAKIYGVYKATICDICLRKTWKWVR